jgi:hypothetical protein
MKMNAENEMTLLEVEHVATPEEIAMLAKVARLAQFWDCSVEDTLSTMLESFGSSMSDDLNVMAKRADEWRRANSKTGGFVLYEHNLDREPCGWVAKQSAKIEAGQYAVGVDAVWITGKPWRKIAE